eukprot:3940679-Rhodomonas_salina.1
MRGTARIWSSSLLSYQHTLSQYYVSKGHFVWQYGASRSRLAYEVVCLVWPTVCIWPSSLLSYQHTLCQYDASRSSLRYVSTRHFVAG